MYCCCSTEDGEAAMVEVDAHTAQDSYKTAEGARDPGGPGCMFEVTVRKLNGQAGLEFSKADTGVLTVSGIAQPGPVADWNNSCRPGEDVRLYDRVIKVNGKAGTALDLLSAMKADQEVFHLIIERPEIKEVQVSKQGRELGLVLFVSTANRLHSGLVISVVKDDAIVSGVKPHDRIIQVNGRTLPPSELLEGVRAEELTMKVCCYNT
mmetsp:Transcript_26163/g.62385  ORF Transcript_26163/g.62385 Transcript_26163/m.62385 type:complete len:208 (+) Transcript_26163:46-669(+)